MLESGWAWVTGGRIPFPGERVGLRAVEAHARVERSLRRGQPVGFWVAGSMFFAAEVTGRMLEMARVLQQGVRGAAASNSRRAGISLRGNGLTSQGFALDIPGNRAQIRTLRYAQEAIRHKRTTSHAARGPLPFIPFAS
jgi:hypothetical protein